MFIELVDSLRCVQSHEDTWLVAAVTEMQGRHIITGALGCPVCGAEYPIVNGVTSFLGAGASPATAVDASAEAPLDDAALTLRGAALLALAEGGGAVALGGAWARVATRLAELAGVQVIAVNPPELLPSAGGVSPILVAGALPLRDGALRGAAFDRAVRELVSVASTVRAVRAGGRVVLPADTPIPDEVTELARDAREWVGERAATSSSPIRLALARPR